MNGPKNNQSLCSIVMGILSLRIGLMEWICFVLSQGYLHNKNVNAIPSSCIYKLFQNYNYESWPWFCKDQSFCTDERAIVGPLQYIYILASREEVQLFYSKQMG